MDSNHIMRSCRGGASVITRLFAFWCLLSCGCGSEISSTQQVSSADYDSQREWIEQVFRASLPESARSCRYHFKNYGMGYSTGWGYFEIPRRDMRYLLDASDYLPDASEFGHHHSRLEIEKYMERTGESIAWWKPLTLQKRQYAQKVIDSENVTDFFELIMLPVINICVGEIRDDWMGVYLVYECG